MSWNIIVKFVDSQRDRQHLKKSEKKHLKIISFNFCRILLSGRESSSEWNIHLQ